MSTTKWLVTRSGIQVTTQTEAMNVRVAPNARQGMRAGGPLEARHLH